jgi:hypothetical protein
VEDNSGVRVVGYEIQDAIGAPCAVHTDENGIAAGRGEDGAKNVLLATYRSTSIEANLTNERELIEMPSELVRVVGGKCSR